MALFIELNGIISITSYRKFVHIPGEKILYQETNTGSKGSLLFCLSRRLPTSFFYVLCNIMVHNSSLLHHHVDITTERTLDMRMWYRYLSLFDGVASFFYDNITIAPYMRLFTDATDSAFRCFYYAKWFQDFFTCGHV